MHIGTVKFFDDKKGYGFIEYEGGEAFVHYSSIEGIGHRTLTQGETVEFELVEGPRGPQAKNVRKVR